MTAREKAIRSLWTDRCTVLVRSKQTDPVTHITGFTQQVLCEDEPCKVSVQTLAAAGTGSTAALAQSIKLFVSNTCSIPPGSQILVTRDNQTTAYVRSGVPGVFTYHQEVMLESAERWA